MTTDPTREAFLRGARAALQEVRARRCPLCAVGRVPLGGVHHTGDYAPAECPASYVREIDPESLKDPGA